MITKKTKVSTPRVSVLMPVYNTNTVFLQQAIDSILNQTFTDFEFLILNDSPDNKDVEKLIKSYKDKRIKYYKNPKNIGISESRNKLLELSSGEYIAIFDHDDISVPERLEKEVEYLDKHPEIGVVSGWLEYFGNTKNIIRNPEFDDIIRISLTNGCYVAHTAAMVRKSIFIENNIKYENDFYPAEDYALLMRLMDVTKFYNIQEVLVRYRQHDTNTSLVKNNLMNFMHEKIQTCIINKYPAYRFKYQNEYSTYTRFRIRLFGFIPLIKIKRNIVYLFEFIPLCKVKWK